LLPFSAVATNCLVIQDSYCCLHEVQVKTVTKLCFSSKRIPLSVTAFFFCKQRESVHVSDRLETVQDKALATTELAYVNKLILS